jgi:hypothetical protein
VLAARVGQDGSLGRAIVGHVEVPSHFRVPG